VSRDRAEENDRATLAALSDPERACAVLLAYGTGGDVPWAAAKARALAPRDAVEARLLALLDLLGPAAAKGVVAGSPLGSRLAGALVSCAEALDKHRGRGQQVVRVEHVHVHPGGRAVVGAVSHGGRGDGAEIEHQPHAPRLAHEPSAPMRGEDAAREPVPAGGGEGPATLPDARRGQGQRRADGAGERAVEARPARRGGAGREGDGAAAAAAGAGRAGEPVGRG
jgi:hypothetical protein